MDKQKMFAVWDATKPSVADVEEYLHRLKTRTMLPLVYYYEGRVTIEHGIVSLGDRRHLLGILLPSKTMLCLQTLHIFPDLAIRGWSPENFTELFKEKFRLRPLKFYPATPAAVRDLQRCIYEVRQTRDVLFREHYELPSFDWENLMWLDRRTLMMHNDAGQTMPLHEYVSVNPARELPIFARGLHIENN